MINLYLLGMAWSDYKYGYVLDCWYLLFIPFIDINWIVIGVMVLVLFNYHLIEKYIGGADIKVMALLWLLYGSLTSLIVLMASCLALLVLMINKKTTIRFIPYLNLSAIIVSGLNHVV